MGGTRNGGNDRDVVKIDRVEEVHYLSAHSRLEIAWLAIGSPGGLDNTVTMETVLGLKHLPESSCLIQNQVEPSIMDSFQMENLLDFRIMYSMIYCGYNN